MTFSGIYTKAAVLIEQNKPLEIMDDVMVPLPGRGQVLVKIKYAGLCHSQLMEIQGNRGEDKYLPHMLGHEGVGEVIKIGNGISKVKEGDPVVLGWIKGKGLDGNGCQYKTSRNIIVKAGGVTTFSEYAIVSENRVTLKPINTPTSLSILYGCAIPTGLGMVLNTIDNRKSKISIAFLGLGGVGLSALLSIKLLNPYQAIAIDINSKKLALAKLIGATHTINPLKKNVFEEIMRVTNHGGVDYCFESAGRIDTIEQAFSIIRPRGGKCIFASHPPSGSKISLDPFDLICGKKIEGTWGGSAKPDEDIKKFDRYYQKGLLPLEKFISKEYSLDKINVAVQDLRNKKIVRALIKCI